MARRRYQTGCLFKRGKRRKVWVARWREDVLLEGGQVGRLQRSVVLGTVADLPTKRRCAGAAGRTTPADQPGHGEAGSVHAFGAFVETQWKTLVLPTFKLSTQHGYKNVLNKHRAALLARLAAARHRTARRFSSGSPTSSGSSAGWQTVRNAWMLLSGILETAVEYGYLTMNPARGVKFPQKALKEKPAIIAGDELRQAARASRRTVPDDGRVSSRRRGCGSASCWPCGGARSISRSGRWRCASRCTRGKFQPPKTQKARADDSARAARGRGADGASERVDAHGRRRSRVRRTAAANRCASRSCWSACCNRRRKRRGSDA